MDNFAITAADAVSRRYKSNDPEAIIAQRTIKIKDIRFCEELLGFYTVLLNCEYIGINPNCSEYRKKIMRITHSHQEKIYRKRK